jgi:hypothetical protein
MARDGIDGCGKERLRLRNKKGGRVAIFDRAPGRRKFFSDRSKRCAMCTPEVQDRFMKINTYYQLLDSYFAVAARSGGRRRASRVAQFLSKIMDGATPVQLTTLLLPWVISRAAR